MTPTTNQCSTLKESTGKYNIKTAQLEVKITVYFKRAEIFEQVVFSGISTSWDLLIGVCSIFLRVDRYINDIYKPKAFFKIKIFYKKYVFISY